MYGVRIEQDTTIATRLHKAKGVPEFERSLHDGVDDVRMWRAEDAQRAPQGAPNL